MRTIPGILGAFNEPTPDWLSFFMFTHFTDRDGKFQLKALAESGFDPLARTTRFMLTEEAHHMFVGDAGVSRVIQRTCQVMNELGSDDPQKLRAAGVIDLRHAPALPQLPLQRDPRPLRADQSSNAATFYGSGLKGRFDEAKFEDDHRLHGETYEILEVKDGGSSRARADAERPERSAARRLHPRFAERRGPVEQAHREDGVSQRLFLPHKAFNRRIGTLSAVKVSPDGRVVSDTEWSAHLAEWLPTEGDRAFVASLMGRVIEPGKFAGWIAPPASGINGQAFDFQYVRFG
jgi:benzoyl-CoA 2,3-dioxygenase component B